MRKKILKSGYFYFALVLCFLVIMAIRQSINDLENYHTVVNITYNDGTKDVIKEEGRPDIHLEDGNLSVNCNIVKSYVKTFEWKVYKNK